MTCPCCGNAGTFRDEHHQLAEICGGCGHFWYDGVGDTAPDYHTRQQRNNPASAAHREKLVDRMKSISPLLKPGMRILEIGCAEGSLGQLVRELVPVSYTGIELSADADCAAKVLDRVVRGTAASIVGETFDLLLSFHVLEHIDDIAGELANWRRLILDSGTLLVEVPNQAGHPLLSLDRNPEHLHQFTAASLTALLQRSGFEVRHLETGHFESAVYADSIRVVARPAPKEAQRRADLLKRFSAYLPGPFVAWGIGGDFRAYVEPLLDSLSVAALIDSAAQRHGERHGHLVVRGYDPDCHGSLPVLICSVRYREAILSNLIALGMPPSRITSLDDIFGGVST